MNVMVQNNLLMDLAQSTQGNQPRSNERSTAAFSKLHDAVMKEMEAATSLKKKGATGKPEEMALYGTAGTPPIEPHADNGQDQEQMNQTVSICHDMEQATRIAGILEGFGLLTDDTDGSEQISTRMEGTSPVLFPLGEGMEGAQEDQPIQPLVDKGTAALFPETGEEPLPELPTEEHLGSLENTNNQKDAIIAADAWAADRTIRPAQPQEKPERSTLLRLLEEAAVRTAKAPREAMAARPILMKEEAALVEETPQEAAPITFSSSLEDVALAEEGEPLQVVSQNDMEENISKLVEKITSQQVSGEQEFTIDLKPDFLGKLSIKLITDGDGIKAQIKAADLAAKSLIQQEIPGLTETLKSRGVLIHSVEVSYETAAFQFDTNQGQAQQQFGGQSKHKRIRWDGDIAQFDLPTLEELTKDMDLETKNGSVEFRA